ncbi:MAG TPA: hypothetical protein VHG92_06420 [Afifellaceae bacterium]|nr:hypothetical protein [Afifellaceae bacterium]
MSVIAMNQRRPRGRAAQAARHVPKKDRGQNRVIPADRNVELWHTPEGEPWASVDGQNWPVRSPQFQQWLFGRTYRDSGKVLTEAKFKGLISVVAAQATYDCPEYPVHLRTAEHVGALYLDLADRRGRAVRITGEGWEIAAAPVKFYRPPEMRPLPEPRRTKSVSAGAELDELHHLLRLESEADFRLFLTAVTAALRPNGPYPVVIINGEQGSGKSVLARMFRHLTDPNAVPFTGPPTNERDLVAKAKNHHVVAFDNVSGIKEPLADALCRLATGGGLGGRKLYTDTDEAVFLAQRPILLNGIPDLARRGDLADRALGLTLPPIVPSQRLPEMVLWERFYAAFPVVLGRLLDIMVLGLKRLPEILGRPQQLPRMADFAVWGMAVAPALGWSEQDFLTAYDANRKAGQLSVLETDPVAEALIRLLEMQDPFEGTATELLDRLNALDPSARSAPQWPRDAAQMGERVTRLVPALAARGIAVTRDRSSVRRTIRISRVAD